MSKVAKVVRFKENVKEYCAKKEEEKVLKKEISALSSDIKTYLTEEKESYSVVGNWRVELQDKVSEDLDEDKLINLILQFWENNNIEKPCPYIVYKPVIDMEKLESAIYNREVPEVLLDAIDKCRIRRTSTALIYKKAKKED